MGGMLAYKCLVGWPVAGWTGAWCREPCEPACRVVVDRCEPALGRGDRWLLVHQARQLGGWLTGWWGCRPVCQGWFWLTVRYRGSGRLRNWCWALVVTKVRVLHGLRFELLLL